MNTQPRQYKLVHVQWCTHYTASHTLKCKKLKYFQLEISTWVFILGLQVEGKPLGNFLSAGLGKNRFLIGI